MPRFVETVLKRLLDNRFYWNVVEGPLYNALIYRTLDGAYDHFFRMLAIPDGARILDIGSGAGQATLRLAARYPGAFIHGIDYAAVQVRIAQWLQRIRKVRNTGFRTADALSLPFEDQVFDVVVSLASIKHWAYPERGLSEIHRVLKPGCFAHIIECDAGTTREEINGLAERAAWYFPLKQAIAWYQEHVVFGQGPAREKMSLLAQEAGFREVAITRMEELPFFYLMVRK
jgi:ubiquinone/menaquinone biosynthesis C-methylase UbiE